MEWDCTSFLHQIYEEKLFSDRWWDFLCQFGRKEPDVRKSSDTKNGTFVNHILSTMIGFYWE